MATPVDIINAVVEELRRRDIPVELVDGWETRDRPGQRPFEPQGVVMHHTAGPDNGQDYPSFGVVKDGRADLQGPLANFGIGRITGTVFVFAAGTANHAGPGGFAGLAGNKSVWGIEAENNGVGEPWSENTLRSYLALVGLLARHTPFGADHVCAHREWNPGEKIDPTGIEMDDFRSKVTAFLEHDVLDSADLTEDERNAVLFTGQYLQEVKEDQSFVADIVARLDGLERRLAALG